MGKWWSVLFGVMMAAAAGLFFVAPFVEGWWLPKGVSTHAANVDRLFYIILAITGFFFILTEALLVIFLWRFAHRPGEVKPHVFGHHAMEEKGALWTSFFKRFARPVSAILHDQHRIELAWTLVPAVILLYIAFAQVNTWADVKYRSRMPALEAVDHAPLQLEISARQFEWRMRYPSPERWDTWAHPDKHRDRLSKEQIQEDIRDFARNPQPDDVHVVNQLHCWTNAAPKDPGDAKEFPAVVVQLRTLDILHSFNIPYMRVKQDSLPGKIIPVWFRPTHWNTAYNPKTKRWQDGYDPDTKKFGDRSQIWEIPCAELCGWGHSRMVGRVYVHRDEQDFLRWLTAAKTAQESTQREKLTAAR